MKMKTRNQQGFTLIELLVVITIIAILASLAVPTFSKIQEKGNQTKGISNCRQIITTLKLYSSDNNGQYPDSSKTNTPTTSNAAFRLMFVGGQCDNEMIFGCPASKFNPDGKSGPAGTNTDALTAGENHWALMGGESDSSGGNSPLVFENATAASVPPTWDATQAGKPIKGRAWGGGKIIVGMNDSSVSILPLTASTGVVGLKNTEVFAPGGVAITGTVLDIIP